MEPSKTIITDKCIIHIHHPDITEEERAKRMKAIEKAAANLILAHRRAEALAARKAAGLTE